MLLLLIFQESNETLFTVAISIVVCVILYFIGRKYVLRQEELKKADPERFGPSSKAKAAAYEAIGNKFIFVESAGWGEHYIAVTEDTVYVAQHLLGSSTVKRYPIDSISAVNVSGSGKFKALELVIPGGIEGKGLLGTIQFSEQEIPKGQLEWRVKEIANAILELRNKPKTNITLGDATQRSIPDSIKQLADLRSAGCISEEEYETKKKELLTRM